MTPTITISLPLLRDLIFDIGGLDKEHVSIDKIGIELLNNLELHPYFEHYFHFDIEGRLLWNIQAWNKSVERFLKDKEKHTQATALHFLRKEALLIFAKELRRMSRVDIETSISIGERLIRKKDWKKFSEISRIDMSNEKWKRLME